MVAILIFWMMKMQIIDYYDIIYEDKFRMKLQNVETGKTFYMTKAEADIAIFRS